MNRHLMSNKAIARRIVTISEQIAEGYMDTDYVIDLIESDNGHIYVSLGDEVIKVRDITDVDPNNIVGYLTGKKYDSFKEFDNDMPYGDMLRDSKYDAEAMFPTMNLKSISVIEDVQGQGIGTEMMVYAMGDADDLNGYPIISRMWKKANQNNNHIQKAQELGGNVIGELDSFLENLECNICEEYDCGCSEVIVVFEKNW